MGISRGNQPKVGERYNHLLIKRRLENHVTPSGAVFSRWLCVCDCGNEVAVLGSSLMAGHTKSCGCLSKRHKVLDGTMIGKRFGMLTVVSRAPSHKIPSGSVYDKWNCICDCGNRTVSFGKNLRKRTALSCGCQRVVHMAEAARVPKAETWTKVYFDEYNIIYEHPKTFPDLIGQNNGLLSYDFYLPIYNILLELNGLQHYKSVEWFGGDETLQKQMYHDALKREYADTHGYNYVVIDTDRITRKSLIKVIESLNL